MEQIVAPGTFGPRPVPHGRLRADGSFGTLPCMVRWRVQQGVWGFVLALPLLACGGKSSATNDSRPHGGAAGNEAGGAAAEDGGPELGGAPDTADDGRASAGSHASDGGRANGIAGQVESAGDSSVTPAGSGGTTNDPGECRGEVCRLSVDREPRWVTKLSGYGRGAARIDLSDAPKAVRVGLGELDYYINTLDLATGELIEEPTKVGRVYASDRTGRRWVSWSQECEVFIDGSERFRLPSCGSANAVRFSEDGSVIANQYCLPEAGGIQLEAYEAESGQLIASATADLPCFSGDFNVLVDVEGRRTLFGHPARSELFVFDWKTQTIGTRTVHQAAPVSNHSPFNREGTILNISRSPDGQHVVSVGAADGLAWLEPATLAVQQRLPGVPFFNVYDDCYTTYLDESPVAWSPGGEIFATARAGGGVVLREVATQKELAVLDPPTDHEIIKAASSCSSEFGPVLMDFTPDMQNLVVLYPVHASVYSLSAR